MIRSTVPVWRGISVRPALLDTKCHQGVLTHWGRVTHICVSKLTITGSDNGLSPGRRQAIIWTNAGILLLRILGTNFREILSEIHAFSFKKMHLKVSSAKWRPFCLGLNVLRVCSINFRVLLFRFALLWFCYQLYCIRVIDSSILVTREPTDVYF